MHRLSIPGGACVHCGTIIGQSLICPGCDWADPHTRRVISGTTVYDYLCRKVGWVNSEGGLYGDDGTCLIQGEGLVAPIREVLSALNIDPDASASSLSEGRVSDG